MSVSTVEKFVWFFSYIYINIYISCPEREASLLSVRLSKLNCAPSFHPLLWCEREEDPSGDVEGLAWLGWSTPSAQGRGKAWMHTHMDSIHKPQALKKSAFKSHKWLHSLKVSLEYKAVKSGGRHASCTPRLISSRGVLSEQKWVSYPLRVSFQCSYDCWQDKYDLMLSLSGCVRECLTILSDEMH